jgi:hypothetical protein
MIAREAHMLLTELRKELLRQHAVLREIAEEIAAAPLDELRPLLEKLYAAVRAHNRYEETELHAVLPKIDAWGPIRDELVDTHHSAEHAAILHGLETASSVPDGATAAAATLEVLRELAAHMDREERELLAPDVLKDDLITSGIGG